MPTRHQNNLASATRRLSVLLSASLISLTGIKPARPRHSTQLPSAVHTYLRLFMFGVWAVSCVALLNVDTVSVWVAVCCSLGCNDLEVEGGKAIAAAMQHTPNMNSLE